MLFKDDRWGRDVFYVIIRGYNLVFRENVGRVYILVLVESGEWDYEFWVRVKF